MPIGRDLTDALTELVRELMEESGTSGNRLAAKVGVDQTTVAKHLCGQGAPTVDHFAAYAAALGSDLEALLVRARKRV